MTNWLDGDLSSTFNRLSPDLHGMLDQLRSRFEQSEPKLQCFVPEKGRFERLHRETDQVFAAHPDFLFRHDLFGVPIGVKDLFHVEGLPTHAGSRLPPEELAGPEAEIVSRLRRKGALIVGKTVCTEFAYFAPGPTRNPRDTEHTPGGSSSGSAAAVAAGLCPAALGTQTIGSILRPAAFCGVVGFKPSYGRVSAQGLIPLAPSLDHVGFFAANVLGAITLSVALFQDYSSNIESLLRQPVLGIPEGPYLSRVSDEGQAHFRDTCDWLTARYKVKSVPAMPDFPKIETRHHRLVAAEAAKVHQDWFQRHRGLYAPQTAELIERGQAVSSQQHKRDRAGLAKLRNELTALMDEHRIDLWISPPAVGAAPRGLESTGDPVMNVPWTHAGMPALCLPAGRNGEGLPLGLQVAARWGADEDLLFWGGALERLLAS